MKNNYLVMIMLLSLIIIPCITATDSSYTFKQNQVFNLQVPITDEYNNPVNDSTTCFLNIVDKDQNVIVNYSQMSYGFGGIYSYAVQITTLGTAYGYINCADGTTSGFNTFTIDVTPSGQQGSLGFFIVIMLVLTALIVLGFAIADGWFVIFGGMGLIIFGLYSILNGIAGFKDDLVTLGVSMFILGVGAYLSIKSALEMLGND
jgi:hypothetical protein